MRRLEVCFALAGLVGIALTIAGCGDGGAAAEGDGLSGRLTITGSSTVAPLVSEIAKRFESQHPGVRIDVQTGGSSRGMADARRGTADIGMASRAITAEDGLDAVAIAHDGICLIVHAENDVEPLSDEQVIGVFTGQTSNWQALNADDAAITVVNKADGRSTLEVFLDYFNLPSNEIQADVVIGDNQHGIRTVAGDANAIGYVSIGTAIYERSRGTPIRLLPVGGVEPTLENVSSETYPLSRPLNLVTHGERSELAEAFLAFAASSEVHDLVEAQYFVPAGE